MSKYSEIPITDTYNDVKRWIYSLCRKLKKRHGGDFEEMVAEANLAFLKAYDTFDPTRGAFTTYLTTVIVNSLINVEKKAVAMKRPVVSNLGMDNQRLQDFSSEFLSVDLSDDANKVLQLSFDFAKSKFDECFEFKKLAGGVRRRVVKTLRRDGWSTSRIDRSFREIQGSLV